MVRDHEKLFSAAIASSLANWQHDLPGRHRVCYGGDCSQVLGEHPELQDIHRVESRQCSTPSGTPGLYAEPYAMPFRTHSLDVLILPLTLDFCESPERVIRESERVIADGGRLVLYGINPWHGWNLLSRFTSRERSRMLARRGHRRVSRGRVIEWLNLLDFTVERQEPLLHGMPVDWLFRQEVFEKFGNRYLPGCGALYAIQAVKHVAPLTFSRAGASIKIAGIEPA